MASTLRICVRSSISFSSVFISRPSLGGVLFAPLGALKMLHDSIDAIDAAANDLSNALLGYSGETELGDEDILQQLNSTVAAPLAPLRSSHSTPLQRPF